LSVRLLSGQHVIADNETPQSLLLVSFEDTIASNQLAQKSTPTKGLSKNSVSPVEVQRIEELQRELIYSKENLQASVEEQQAVNEELKSTNEELQSTNEELQSTNEELETSKEELQSLNEETITVNSELSGRVEQLNCIQDDMTNLLDSIATGMIFLDNQMLIRRYTPEAVRLYRLRLTDIGRPLSDITSNIQGEDVGLNLRLSMQSVLDTLIPFESDVLTIDGTWYLTRIQPYRTLDNVIAGVVLTFTNVTKYKLISIGRTNERMVRGDTTLKDIVD
jgi:two-component system CheB/CheR fusion protein